MGTFVGRNVRVIDAINLHIFANQFEDGIQKLGKNKTQQIIYRVAVFANQVSVVGCQEAGRLCPQVVNVLPALHLHFQLVQRHSFVGCNILYIFDRKYINV